MVRAPIRLSSPAIRYVAMAGDVLIIWACGWLAHLAYPGTASQGELPARYQLMMLAASFMLLALSSGVYRSWRMNELWVMLRSVLLAWLGIMLAILVALFFTKMSADLSRVWFTSWALGTLFVLCVQRLLVYSVLRSLRMRGYNFRTVLLVGQGRLSQSVQDTLAESMWSGLRIVATLPPDGLRAYLAAQQGEKPIDEVWLCLPLSDEPGLRAALAALRHNTANIRLVPDLFSLRLINHGVSEVVGIPMLDLSTTPMAGPNLIVKACEDYCAALVILMVVSPLMLAIAIAIKLTSPGPVLFKQRRHGWNGKEICVYKFRSMVVHKETDFQVSQASRQDVRVTPLGAFLRRTSLDELPQFINVLQGRMSVVGPRPHALVHNDHYKELVPGYMLRHKVKPGVTGWAQINGFRGETDTLDKMQKRVEHDLYYIENWSLWLDLKIIFRTLFKGFTHHNAY